MAQTFRSQVQCSPNRFRSGAFAGMGREPQALRGRIGILLAEYFWRSFLLVTPDANANHIAVAVFGREFEYALCGFRPELADSIEDPKQRNAEVALAAFTPALQALEDGIEIQLPPQTYADGNIDFPP
jgi:hypothetical protein